MSGSRLLRSLVLQGRGALQPSASLRQSSSHSAALEPSKIGAREVVGFGYNGEPAYLDKVDFPFPSVRFRPTTADIKLLREKEKGDWKNLSIAEKKALYRASFCQTFAEINAPTGEWKSITGWTLVVCSLAFWAYLGLKLFVYPSELPPSFKEENRREQLKRMLAWRMNPIEGISSRYDYEKGEWKK